MIVSVGSLSIAAAEDHVRIADTAVQCRVDVQQPLRSANATPARRGATSVRWSIEVTKLHASLAVADAYRLGLPALIAAAGVHGDGTTLTIGTATFASAVVESALIRNLGMTTVCVWSVTSRAVAPA